MLLNFVILVGIFISLANFFTYIDKKTKSSGIPIFGSLLLFISLFFIKSDLLFYILIIIILLDAWGLHWFVFMMLLNLGENFEKVLEKLPSKYKEFLLKCNGKRPIKNAFDIPNEGSGLIDIFYNISNDNLKPLPHNLDILAIGNDQNGNIIGIGISTKNYDKIFFINHETLDIIELSDSFSSFIDSLYEYKDEDLIERLIENNDIKGIKKLIENGFDIHQKNKYGRTIIEEATVFAKNDIIKFLHSIGANLENSIKIAKQNSEFFDGHKKTLEFLKKLEKR